jgi:hypothetical protein
MPIRIGISTKSEHTKTVAESLIRRAIAACAVGGFTGVAGRVEGDFVLELLFIEGTVAIAVEDEVGLDFADERADTRFVCEKGFEVTGQVAVEIGDEGVDFLPGELCRERLADDVIAERGVCDNAAEAEFGNGDASPPEVTINLIAKAMQGDIDVIQTEGARFVAVGRGHFSRPAPSQRCRSSEASMR